MTEANAATAVDLARLPRAMELLKEALDKLDEGKAPSDIGAHVDHAIVRLAEFLGTPWG